jgi:hypothetical protein
MTVLGRSDNAMWLRRCSTHAGAAFNALAQKRFGTGHERFAEPLTLSKLSVLREAWTTTLQERKPLPVGEVLLWLSKTDTIDADVTGDGVNAGRALETIEALEAASPSKIEWGERGASLIIRLLADVNRVHDATVRLDALKAPKRRSVTPILEACARTDDGATAHRLWQFATDACKLRMTETELCPVLWTQRRDPRRVHELLTKHAACGDNGVLSPDAAESVSSTLIAAGALVEEANIDEATGKCDQCGAVLQPQEISIEDRDALLRGITESIPKPQRATFAIFERYMESCARNVEWCPTVVLDGANIGYFAVPSSSGGPPRMGDGLPAAGRGDAPVPCGRQAPAAAAPSATYREQKCACCASQRRGGLAAITRALWHAARRLRRCVLVVCVTVPFAQWAAC